MHHPVLYEEEKGTRTSTRKDMEEEQLVPETDLFSYKTKTLLDKFVYVKTLAEDSLSKKVVLHGTIENDDAILTLEKTTFHNIEHNLHLYLKSVLASAINDVYHWGVTAGPSNLHESPSCKYSLIYPATETHLRKYKPSSLKMIVETPEAYELVVKPYISTMKGDRIKWVKNILYEGAEAERVLFKNEDYIVLPDLKWDGKDINLLYCCCIVYDETISSIRDLNVKHIDYLKKIEASLISEITRHYESLNSSDLRLYIHYQPSYYHFHIHVVNINNLAQYGSFLAGKAILLHDVIDNLQYLGSEGYAKKTITYQLQDTLSIFVVRRIVHRVFT